MRVSTVSQSFPSASQYTSTYRDSNCTPRRESVSKSLWDEHEMNVSLRNFALREPNPCPEEVLSAVEADDADAVDRRTKVNFNCTVVQ